VTLPAWNATLNAASAACLVAGYLAIRRRKVRWHRACMLTAFILSSAFLASYLLFHARAGIVHFQGDGWLHVVYLLILIPHSILAAVVAPAAVAVIGMALRKRWALHRRLARWLLPAWVYVSVTGVVVYYLLFVFPRLR
jgi:putative membrane protein